MLASSSAALVDALPGRRRFEKRSITVMQFNCLCAKYEPDHLAPELCQWQHRQARIKAQIDAADADVVFLQEAQPAEWYGATFGAKYDIVFAMKADAAQKFPSTDHLRVLRRSRQDDGSLVMFKRSTVACREAVLLNTFDDEGTMARQNMLVALCQLRATGNTFIAAGMHMAANRYDARTQETIHIDEKRCLHLMQLLPKIVELRKRWAGLDTAAAAAAAASGAAAVSSGDLLPPIVFAGDFNAAPADPTIQLLLKGETIFDGEDDAEGSAVSFRDIKFQSAMALTGSEPPFTILDSSYNTTGAGWNSVLDYVLIEAGRFALVGCWSHPAREDYGKDALPFTGSDHIPLVVELAFVGV